MQMRKVEFSFHPLGSTIFDQAQYLRHILERTSSGLLDNKNRRKAAPGSAKVCGLTLIKASRCNQ